MNKQEQYKALSNFLDWFEDNFANLTYLDPEPTDEEIKSAIEQTSKEDVDRELNDGGLWKYYDESPEFIAACKALQIMRDELDSPEAK